MILGILQPFFTEPVASGSLLRVHEGLLQA